MLYKPPKTKRYILIGVAALVVLVLVFWGAWRMKPKSDDALPVGIQKENEEIDREAIKSLTAPQESRENQEEQKALDTLNEVKENLTAPENPSNSNNQPSPISPKVLDSLNAK